MTVVYDASHISKQQYKEDGQRTHPDCNDLPRRFLLIEGTWAFCRYEEKALGPLAATKIETTNNNNNGPPRDVLTSTVNEQR
ncbi:hypothetical protein Zmor_024413 [Zophobas morio]|uniref:Uncharacterized protein n=1 Tax=Zophobas morio TaxID=2755281 RepID=A0AA38I514_9CUCU|nr:hypothetical protein Zmor_024413 [Zophobas morio]